jgi:4-carboxymuconolactone decarboxylase
MTDEERFEAGLQVRRAVLGDEYVDRSLAAATDFTRPFQDLVSRYCWGDIWCRPGLDRKQRSIVNLAMISALNRPHELKLHVRGALNNGLTREEIREVFMQVAVYCGIPAGLDSFRAAQEVFAETDRARDAR